MPGHVGCVLFLRFLFIIGVRGSPERHMLLLGAGGEGTRTGPWWSCVVAVAAAAARLGRRGGGGTNVLGPSMDQNKLLYTSLCREFRSETDAGSEIIQIKAKMKVGWKSLNSQIQAENCLKNRSPPKSAFFQILFPPGGRTPGSQSF